MGTVQGDHELAVVMKPSTTAVVDNHACVPHDDKKQNDKVKPLMTAKTTLSPDANTPSIPIMPSVDEVSGGRALDNSPCDVNGTILDYENSNDSTEPQIIVQPCVSPDHNKKKVPIMQSTDENLLLSLKEGSPNSDVVVIASKINDDIKVRHLLSIVYVMNAMRICEKQNLDLSNGQKLEKACVCHALKNYMR